MKTIVIFHGIQGHAEENWFPWLKRQLEAKKHRVIVPNFPHPEAPIIDEWLNAFKTFEPLVNDDAMFIGHSLGAAFVLRLLEQATHPIATAVLVAPVWGIAGNAFDPLMATFTQNPYEWDVIRSHCHNFSIVHSNDDPYLQLANTQELAKHLSTDVTVIENGGHFNAASGFTSFPQLLNIVEEHM